MPSGYPLQWPPKRERTPARDRSKSPFGNKSLEARVKELRYEIDRLNGQGLVISSNQPRTKAGAISGANYLIVDPGVAVYFTIEGMAVQFACDRWETVGENIRAIALHLNSLRGQERWGAGTKKEAFSGYAALVKVSSENWRPVLGLPRFGKISREQVERQHRKLLAEVHPDRGGSPEAAARFNVARDEALDWLTAQGE